MPKDMPADMQVKAVAGHPVELPGGNFIANAVMTRVGQDLHLTADGHTVVVQGYFAMGNPPELVTHDGAHLSSTMVDAFVQTEHPGQYAASGQIENDASPAGQVTQVVGRDEIIRADGTHVIAAVGTPVYQGDVVETSKTGALNILFSDHTTFAVSESARMSIDKYVYHSAEHTGSTFFSMLQGMFVYTSGLIGKTEPGNVNIETPVGSIGIRGTVIAGHISPAGHASDITIVNGAITVTNGSGTVDMSNSFQTVSLDGYNAQPQPVTMDASTFSADYSSLSGVAADTLHHFVTMAPAANSGSPATAPAMDHATTAPATDDHSTITAPATSTDGTTSSANMTTDMMLTSSTNTSATPAPTTASSFGATGAGSFGATNTTNFNTTSPAAGAASGGTAGMATVSASSPSAPTATATTPGTAAAAAPPPFAVQLSVDSGYSSTDHITNNAMLQTINLATTAATIMYAVENGSTWNAAAAAWSMAQPSPANGTYTVEAEQLDSQNHVISTSEPLTFTLDTVAPVAPTLTLATDTSGGSMNTSDGQLNLSGIEANAQIQYSTNGGTTWTTTTALPTTWTQGANTVEVRQVDLAGNTSSTTTLSFTYDTVAPVAPTVALQHDTGFAGTDITNSPALTIANQESGATLQYSTDGGATWSSSAPTTNGTYTVEVEQKDIAGNISAVSPPLTYTLDTSAVMITAASLGQTLTESGSNNVLLGVGNDTIQVFDTSFLAADGGTGTNTLDVGSSTTTAFTLDTTQNGTLGTPEHTNIHNIADIILDTSTSSQGNSITLNETSLFGMANDGSGNHTLNISGGTGEFAASVNIHADTSVGVSGVAGAPGALQDLHLTSGTWGVSSTLTYTGTYINNLGAQKTATLNVQEFGAGGNSLNLAGGVVAADSPHGTAIYDTNMSIGHTMAAAASNEILLSNANTSVVSDNGFTGESLIGSGGFSGGTGGINISNNTFLYIDGGDGGTNNTLTLGTASSSPFTVDFTNASIGTVRNIESINLGTSNVTGTGNSIAINAADVFNMSPSHAVFVQDTAGAGTVTLSGSSGFTVSDGTSGGIGNITYTGHYNSSTVTLVVHEAAATGTGHVAVTMA